MREHKKEKNFPFIAKITMCPQSVPEEWSNGSVSSETEGA
jgi:hypothetical protein